MQCKVAVHLYAMNTTFELEVRYSSSHNSVFSVKEWEDNQRQLGGRSSLV